MPRLSKVFAGLLLTTASASAMPFAPMPSAPTPTHIEYFCSDGFAPRGGRCVATAFRDEIELFEVEPYAPPRLRLGHRRRGLRTLY